MIYRLGCLRFFFFRNKIRNDYEKIRFSFSFSPFLNKFFFIFTSRRDPFNESEKFKVKGQIFYPDNNRCSVPMTLLICLIIFQTRCTTRKLWTSRNGSGEKRKIQNLQRHLYGESQRTDWPQLHLKRGLYMKIFHDSILTVSTNRSI